MGAKNPNHPQSQYKGVNWDNRAKKFRAVIVVDTITHHCGMSHSDREAAIMRDKFIIAHNLVGRRKLQVLKPMLSTNKPPNGTFD